MMGMYTSVIDRDGEEWQIKHGNDECNTYTINVKGNHPFSDDVPDGVYAGIGGDLPQWKYAYVVFKNDTCVDIVPYSQGSHDYQKIADLIAKHGLKRRCYGDVTIDHDSKTVEVDDL